MTEEYIYNTPNSEITDERKPVDPRLLVMTNSTSVEHIVYIVACPGKDRNKRLHYLLKQDIRTVLEKFAVPQNHIYEIFLSRSINLSPLESFQCQFTAEIPNMKVYKKFFKYIPKKQMNYAPTVVVLWNPSLEDWLYVMTKNDNVNISFFFSGHGNDKGHLILGDVAVNPRVMFEKWIKKRQQGLLHAYLTFNCCFGLLAAQLLSGKDEGSLFDDIIQYATPMQNAGENMKSDEDIINDAVKKQQTISDALKVSSIADINLDTITKAKKELDKYLEDIINRNYQKKDLEILTDALNRQKANLEIISNTVKYGMKKLRNNNERNYWLNNKTGMHDVVTTALFFGALDGYTKPVITIPQTCISINPIALGPISLAGMLPQVLNTKDCSRFKIENFKKSVEELSKAIRDRYNHDLKDKKKINCRKKIPNDRIEIYQFAVGDDDSTLFRFKDFSILIDDDKGLLDVAGFEPLFTSRNDETGTSSITFRQLILEEISACALSGTLDAENLGMQQHTAEAGDNGRENGYPYKTQTFESGAYTVRSFTWFQNEIDNHTVRIFTWRQNEIERVAEDNNKAIKKLSKKNKNEELKAYQLCALIEVGGLEKWRGLFTGDCSAESIKKSMKELELDGNKLNILPFHYVDVPNHGSRHGWIENFFQSSDTSDDESIKLHNGRSVIGISADGNNNPHVKVVRNLPKEIVKCTFRNRNLNVNRKSITYLPKDQKYQLTTWELGNKKWSVKLNKK